MGAEQIVLNRKLARAIASLNTDQVVTLLKEGADPSASLPSRYDFSYFPLTLAARKWHSEKSDAGQRERADSIIHILLDAGADPLAYEEGESPLFDPSVGTHPRCKKHILQGLPEHVHAILRLDKSLHTQRWGTRKYLKYLASAKTPLRQELLDRFFEASTVQDTEGWWVAAIEAPTSYLMTYLLEKQGKTEKEDPRVPSLEWMVELRGTPREADGILAWLDAQTAETQAAALLGSPEKEGLLAATLDKNAQVRDGIWEFALNQEHITATMKERGMTKGFLALSMLANANHAQKLLRMALREGIDAASMTAQDARLVKSRISDWDRPFLETEVALKPDATLLTGHLKKTSHSPSVTLMRALVKAGVKPDYEALCYLCRHMTYKAKEKRYLPLFDEWTTTHRVNPAPEGRMPVWEFITLSRPEVKSREGFQNFLQARYVERIMDQSISEPDDLQVPLKRSSGLRL